MFNHFDCNLDTFSKSKIKAEANKQNGATYDGKRYPGVPQLKNIVQKHWSVVDLKYVVWSVQDIFHLPVSKINKQSEMSLEGSDFYLD